MNGTQEIDPGSISKNPLWTRIFLLNSLASFAIFMAFQLLMPTLPEYIKILGGKEATVGLINGIFTASAVMIRPWVGTQLDQTGRRKVLILGLAVFVISVISYNWAPTVFWLLAFRLIHGAGWGASTTASGTIASDVIPASRRAEGMGYFGLFGTVAMAVAPALGMVIRQDYGFSVLFYTSAGLAGVSLLLASTLVYNEPLAREKIPVRRALYEKTALHPSLVVFFQAITYGGVVSFITLFAIKLGLKTYVGPYFMVYAIVLMLTRPLAGIIADRKGHSWVILPGYIFVLAGVVLLAFSSGPMLFLLSAAVYAVGFGATQPTLQALAVTRSAPERRGAANATFFSAFDLGIGIGSLTLGIIAQKIGFTGMYLIAAALGSLGLMFYAVLGKKSFAR
ncbi:MAG: MFS transporter [Bacillota bacterium]